MPRSHLNLIVRSARESDLQGIIEHFRNHFLEDFPLANYFRLNSENNSFFAFLEGEIKNCMKTPYLNVVVIYQGNIVGVGLNVIQDKNETPFPMEAQIKDDRVKIIIEIMQVCNKATRLYEKYPECKKSFVVVYVSVDTAYRNSGICEAVVTKAIEIAKETACDVMKTECYNYYATLHPRRNGYELIFEQIFEDYVVKGKYKVDEEFMENGRIVIRPKAPHTAMQVYALKLPKSHL